MLGWKKKELNDHKGALVNVIIKVTSEDDLANTQ